MAGALMDARLWIAIAIGVVVGLTIARAVLSDRHARERARLRMLQRLMDGDVSTPRKDRQ